MKKRKSHSPLGGKEAFWQKASQRSLYDMQFQRYGWARYYASDTLLLRALFASLAQIAKRAARVSEVRSGHIPFLLVNRGLPVGDQVGLLEKWRHHKTEFQLDPKELTHLYDREVSSDWYLLIDVEVGRELDGIPPIGAAQRLAAMERSPLDLYDGVALTACMWEALGERVVQLPGSRYRKDDVPYISRRRDGGMVRMRLFYSRPYVTHSGWGVASCKERIFFPRKS